MLKIRYGFSLIELIVVMVIVAIIAAIAIPSYTQFIERQDVAIAKQEAQKVAAELERFKSKNFSYKGFDASYLYNFTDVDGHGNSVTRSHYNPSAGQLLLPVGADATHVKYKLTLVDGITHKPLTIKKGANGTETSESVTIKGLSWAIVVERVKGNDGEPKQPRNSDLLILSSGLRCMTKVKDVVSLFTGCGSHGESW
ncbi:prepilin-type N-terminal cleavage/methylation domain-containing protein [Acinetobacter nematophilus]|uniref:prepilin-type N-terminal cleavage/methylation domain-containing protein n=1 Tax=Acinetobacter nematophilus TaxID=2994642 RepID=UPI003AF95C6A